MRWLSIAFPELKTETFCAQNLKTSPTFKVELPLFLPISASRTLPDSTYLLGIYSLRFIGLGSTVLRSHRMIHQNSGEDNTVTGKDLGRTKTENNSLFSVLSESVRPYHRLWAEDTAPVRTVFKDTKRQTGCASHNLMLRAMDVSEHK